jgi:zinc/manganese transport system substrate-binding protein
MRSVVLSSAICASLAIAVGACGSDDTESDDTGEQSALDGTEVVASTDDDGISGASELPTIAVTSNILGDVVSDVVGDSADVVTIMPVGADPHDFQASAQEVDVMMSADALVVNGANFEEGLIGAIESAEAEGVATYEAIEGIDTLELGEAGHDHADEDHADEDHADEDHADDDHADDDHADEEHSGDDPHFFTDPARMAVAVDGIVAFLQDEVAFADPAAVEASAQAYVDKLNALDQDVADLVETIPEENRVLVTNHEVFGYFADRFGFEVVGAVIPGGSTTDASSAGEIAELTETIEEEGVPAIFSDVSSSDDLIQTLADEVGDVAVVALYTESLGEAGSPGETYLGMIRSNAEQITSALS